MSVIQGAGWRFPGNDVDLHSLHSPACPCPCTWDKGDVVFDQDKHKHKHKQKHKFKHKQTPSTSLTLTCTWYKGGKDSRCYFCLFYHLSCCLFNPIPPHSLHLHIPIPIYSSATFLDAIASPSSYPRQSVG